MEFEDKQTSSSPEPAPDAGDNTQFLQSLGFDEEELRSLETDSDDGPEEEVALSSQPDDLEVPGADSRKSATSRVVGVQIGNTAHRVESDGRIEISPTRVAPENEEVNSNPEMETTVESGEEKTEEASPEPDGNLLYLHCPSCDGELVLQKEHVGVEGACVWCDIKIVAARAGLEGEVKVFSLEPIKAEATEKAGIGKAVEGAPLDTAMDPDPVEEEQVSKDFLPETEVSGEAKEVVSEPTDEIAQDVPALEEASEGFSSPWGAIPEGETQEEAKSEEPKENAGAEAGFGGWSGMASMEPAVSTENEEADSSEKPGQPVEGSSVSEPAEMETDAAPDSGFSAWGEAPASFEPEVGGNDQMSESPSVESDAVEMDPFVGFGDMDASPDENAMPSTAEGEGFPEDFAPSPFSGDSGPSPTAESIPPEFNGFDAAPQPVGFEPPAEEPLEALFVSEPEAIESKLQEQNSEGPSSAFEGFGSPAPAPETSSESGWEGTIGSSENPSIELAPLPVPQEPFSSPAPEKAPSQEADVPATDPVDSGFGLPESSGMSGNTFPPAPSETPFSPEANTGEEGGGGFSMGESTGFAGPIAVPAPVSDLEEEFGSPTMEAGAESSPDGFQIPAQGSDGFGMNASAESGSAPDADPVDFASTTSEAPSYADPFSTPVEDNAFEEAPNPETPFFNDDSEIFSPAQDHASAAPAESLFSETPPAPIAENKPAASPFSESPQTEPVPSPFDEVAGQAHAAPPAFPNTEAAPAPETTQNAEPVVEEKKSKPKTKGPRKGLVILLVVLIGFVCGAALASFVLPVDQYIVKARAIMEEKFNPGGAVLNQDLLPQPISANDPQS